MLAERGLRRTGARMAVLTILERAGTHYSVSTLARLTAAVRPTINASTVYRNVTAMYCTASSGREWFSTAWTEPRTTTSSASPAVSCWRSLRAT
ncbi:transcriptional repressor [Acrocarpospora corrugata]